MRSTSPVCRAHWLQSRRCWWCPPAACWTPLSGWWRRSRSLQEELPLRNQCPERKRRRRKPCPTGAVPTPQLLSLMSPSSELWEEQEDRFMTYSFYTDNIFAVINMCCPWEIYLINKWRNKESNGYSLLNVPPSLHLPAVYNLLLTGGCLICFKDACSFESLCDFLSCYYLSILIFLYIFKL